MAEIETLSFEKAPETSSSADRVPFCLATYMPYRIVSLGQLMGSKLSRHYVEEFELSIPEWRTLVMIGQHEALTAAQVVAQTPLDKVAVSRAASRLTERGFIERVPRRDDRRSAHLRLTEEGRRVFNDIATRALRAEALILSQLSFEERDQLDCLLKKLRHAVETLPETF